MPRCKCLQQNGEWETKVLFKECQSLHFELGWATSLRLGVCMICLNIQKYTEDKILWKLLDLYVWALWRSLEPSCPDLSTQTSVCVHKSVFKLELRRMQLLIQVLEGGIWEKIYKCKIYKRYIKEMLQDKRLQKVCSDLMSCLWVLKSSLKSFKSFKNVCIFKQPLILTGNTVFVKFSVVICSLVFGVLFTSASFSKASRVGRFWLE